MSDFTIAALTPDTWDAFAGLAERHNGVWGGCWCVYFTPDCAEKRQSAEGNRALKKRLVEEGATHAALVMDGDEAIAWAEYGTPDELPNIYHRKEYDAFTVTPPDYRITCFFVDKRHRRRGVSALALRGALDLIAAAGGGRVESYPRDTAGKKMSASFLYNGTRTLFEDAGFTYERIKGQHNSVMSIQVAPA